MITMIQVKCTFNHAFSLVSFKYRTSFQIDYMLIVYTHVEVQIYEEYIGAIV